ncbi:uncharacterized protein LOC122003505 isoform X1 [Zingiber officinale]|uniref:uncharacterized protein LOC122003505 isoform X1 n=1 Tax=Zingiber officinale TaxID=94328 RepID=UPI001C4AD961|nr:uncharacterized protein LOC122003505 isoform X1 [Zingiber officinale]
MAEDLEVGEFWLPLELLEDSFAVEKEESQPGEEPVDVTMGMKRDGEEKDYMDGLTRRMTQSFLQDDKEEEEAKRTAAWSSPWEQWKGDEWALFQETGGWVAASAKLNWEPRRQCPAKNSGPGGCFASPLNAHYYWDAARIFQLRQQQFAAAWERQTMTSRGRAGGRGAPPRQLQHRHMPGAGMRAVFLRRSGERKEPVGTGVFLPRTATRNTERKNNSAACPTVRIPAKVAQALNLNIENFPSGFVLQHDAFVEGRNETSATAVPISSGLPQEWTY